MGSLVVHVGELGQGETIKLINNALAAGNVPVNALSTDGTKTLAEGTVMQARECTKRPPACVRRDDRERPPHLWPT